MHSSFDTSVLVLVCFLPRKAASYFLNVRRLRISRRLYLDNCSRSYLHIIRSTRRSVRNRRNLEHFELERIYCVLVHLIEHVILFAQCRYFAISRMLGNNLVYRELLHGDKIESERRFFLYSLEQFEIVLAVYRFFNVSHAIIRQAKRLLLQRVNLFAVLFVLDRLNKMRSD